MADADLREAERAFAATPDDPAALERLVEAHARAGRRDLPWEAVVRLPRWRGLVGFVARFGAPLGPLGPRCGQPVAVLDAAEARLGQRLPVALREWYRLIGRRPDIGGDTQDFAVPPQLLEVRGGVLGIQDENQCVHRWGVLLSDLAEDDPPIVTREDDDEPPVTWNERLSEFCWQMAMHQRAITGPDEDSFVLTRDPRPALEATYPRLPLPGWDWGGSGTEELVFFGDESTIVELDTGTPSVWIVGATDAAAARARALLAPYVSS
jgi:hypothetical protein